MILFLLKRILFVFRMFELNESRMLSNNNDNLNPECFQIIKIIKAPSNLKKTNLLPNLTKNASFTPKALKEVPHDMN
jgi:hypothetical protein